MRKVLHYLVLLQTCLLFSQEPLLENLSFYKDNSNTLTVQDIPTKSIVPLSENTGFNDATFWFQIDLSTQAKGQNIYLSIKETFLKDLHVYNSDGTLIYESDTPSLTQLNIPIQKAEKTYYAKAVFDKHAYIHIDAKPLEDLQTEATSKLLKRGSYYTFILVFVIINLVLSFFFKEKLFLWYILFFLAANLGIALYDNTIAGFVKNPKIIDYLLAFDYWISPVATYMFCFKFLRIKQYYPKIDLGTRILLGFISIAILLFLVTGQFKVLAIAQLMNLTIYLGSWIIGFFLLKKVASAKYYVLGYSVLYFTIFGYSLSVNFGLHFFPLSIEHLKIGVILEILVLTYAIMERAKDTKEENETIKTQLLAYVEELDRYKKQDQKALPEDIIIAEAKKHDLTIREIDILLLLTRGHNYKQISEELFISVNTVKYHLRNIYVKLDVKNRSEITSKLLFNK